MNRHAPLHAGHPRLELITKEDVDDPDKPGHDDIGLALVIYSSVMPGLVPGIQSHRL